MFVPLPKGFIKFLKSKGLTPRARDVVLELIQCTDFDGGTIAVISDDRLSENTGIDVKDLRETINTDDFKGAVLVTRGRRRERGMKPQATRYDLMALLVEYGRSRSPTGTFNDNAVPTPLDVWVARRNQREKDAV
jgi:hypothetical protein